MVLKKTSGTLPTYLNNRFDLTFKELCEEFNISCKTGYKKELQQVGCVKQPEESTSQCTVGIKSKRNELYMYGLN
jgi:hypothetical protein